MPLPVFGAGRLLTPNVVVETQTERTDKDQAGGSKPIWVARATGVRAMYSLLSGGRPGDFHSDAERTRATFRAAAGTVGRSDIRIKVTAALDSTLASLVGTYWQVDSTQNEPAGRGGLLPPSDGAQCSQLKIESV